MKKRGLGDSGFTLVEMLVVMAIVLIMAAVAVPTLARMGAFSRDELGSSGRTVLNMLRAARVYSATFRTDAAVIYFLKKVEDSRDNAPQVVADAVAMARRASFAELRSVFDEPTARTMDNERRHYFVVGGGEGGITPLERGACVQARVGNLADNPVQDQLLGTMPTNLMRQGVFPVKLYTYTPASGGTPASISEVVPRSGLDDVTWGWTTAPLTQFFPAHVFRPNGEMRTERDETPGRLEVRLNFSPDMNPKDRFLVGNKEVAGVRVEINRFTGRSRMVDEEAG